MPGERQLPRRREYAHRRPVVAAFGNERGFRKVHLARDDLHGGIIEMRAILDNGQLITSVFGFGKYIDDREFHGPSLVAKNPKPSIDRSALVKMRNSHVGHAGTFMPGVIEAVNTSPAHGTLQSSVDSAELLVGVGLEGDRYANADGGAVSIIEAEQVEAFDDATGLSISAAVTGRNLVTRGVRLNPLVGKQFKLGEATLECFELCEPCASLAARLSTEAIYSIDGASGISTRSAQAMEVPSRPSRSP